MNTSSLIHLNPETKSREKSIASDGRVPKRGDIKNISAINSIILKNASSQENLGKRTEERPNSSPNNPDLPSGIVARYSFENNFRDSSGYDFHAHPEGNPELIEVTRFNYAAKFDGSDDFLEIPLVLNKARDVTLSAWVNISSEDERGAVLKIGTLTGYGLGVGNSTVDSKGNNLVGLYEWKDWLPSNTGIGTGWHHLLLTIDKNGVPSFYIDGTFIGPEDEFYSDPEAPKEKGFIGGYSVSGYNRYFKGAIDEVIVYNRTLNDEEVKKAYISQKSLFNSALVESAPSTPTNLKAVAFSPYKVVVSWRDTSVNEEYFAVERSKGNSNDFVKIAITSRNEPYYTDEKLESGVKYYYRVRAFKGSLSSSYSNMGEVTTSILNYISLENNDDYVMIPDSQNIEPKSGITWNLWVKQSSYSDKSALLSKYEPLSGRRSYLIRVSLNDSISIVVSGDGNQAISYTSNSARKCGIRNNDEWTMITLTYNGSLIRYYRNGVYCDSDRTTVSVIYDSSNELRFGGGTDSNFNGSLDELRIYNDALTTYQIQRIYNESFHGSSLGISIPVLMYHQIRHNATALDRVTPTSFSQQMDFLHKNGFSTITLNDYDQWRRGRKEIPMRPVIITFDDGWRSVYEEALPVMKKYGFKGTENIIIAYMNRSKGGDSYMHEDMLHELRREGWDLQSHGLTHVDMLQFNEERFTDQLRESKTVLRETFNISVFSFIFPFHSADSRYASLCGRYYRMCWTRAESVNSPQYVFQSTNGTAYQGLRRISITNNTDLEEFSEIFAKDMVISSDWKFDEGQGTSSSDSLQGITATLINGVVWGR